MNLHYQRLQRRWSARMRIQTADPKRVTDIFCERRICTAELFGYWDDWQTCAFSSHTRMPDPPPASVINIARGFSNNDFAYLHEWFGAANVERILAAVAAADADFGADGTLSFAPGYYGPTAVGCGVRALLEAADAERVTQTFAIARPALPTGKQIIIETVPVCRDRLKHGAQPYRFTAYSARDERELLPAHRPQHAECLAAQLCALLQQRAQVHGAMVFRLPENGRRSL
jgi:hypothetical protein